MIFFNVFQTSGPLLSTVDLEKRCIQAGMNKHTFWVYLTYTPILARYAEGVYGLRRAFVLAGAETLVMSLWPVSDYLARDTMVAYYAGLRAGRGRGDALRHAKLAILRRPGRRHPYYWAAFIQSGDWARLNSAP